MAKKDKNQNPFQGLWVVVHTQQQDEKDRWVTHERYRFGDYTLDFQEDKNGDPYTGRMHESITGSRDFDNVYLFSVKDAKILITTVEDGDLRWDKTDVYRVRHQRGMLILYNVCEIDDELYAIPDESWFRLTLKRDNLKNEFVEKLKALFISRIQYHSGHRA